MCLLLLGAHATAGEWWLNAVIDHQRHDLHVRVIEDDGRLLVRPLDLTMLGIRFAETHWTNYDGEPFLSIDSLKEYRPRIDREHGYIHFIGVTGRQPLSSDGVLLLDVVLHGSQPSAPLRVIERDGRLYLPARTWRKLGVAVPDATAADALIDVEAVAGDDYVLDSAMLRLWMSVAPERMEMQHHSRVTPALETLQAGMFSAQLDYSLATGVEDNEERWHGALLGAGVAADFSHCRSRTLLARDTGPWRRLDTYCQHDWPDRRRTFVIGDGVSRGDATGQSVRYGGLRISSDYALAPTMSTQPTLLVPGMARVPSALEVWVDQNLVLQERLRTGPFVVSDIPAQTGRGDLRVVLEDALGERQEYTYPYYNDPSLLRPGLLDWAAEVGTLRTGFGTTSDRYTDGVVALSLRRGVLDVLTLGGRAEYQQDAFAGMGGNIAWRFRQLGVFEVGTQVSRSDDGMEGSLGTLAFSHRGRRLSFGISHMETSDRFRQLGYSESGSAPAEMQRGNLGMSLPRAVSVNAGAYRREFSDGSRQRLYGMGLTMPLLGGQVLLGVTLPDGGDDDTSYSATLTIPLGNRTTAMATADVREETTGYRYGVQRNLPAGEGTGYRVEVADSGIQGDAVEGQLLWQTEVLRASLEGRNTATSGNSGAARVEGSVMYADGRIETLRRTEATAIVMVGVPGVRISLDNQMVATTGVDGRALVSGLRPYQENRLQLTVEDLPINAQPEKTSIIVVPARGQVVRIEFPVRIQYPVIATLVDEAGQPVPPGAQVELNQSLQNVSMGRYGLLYATADSDEAIRLDVRWPTGHCQAVVPSRAIDEVVRNAGTLICREVP